LTWQPKLLRLLKISQEKNEFIRHLLNATDRFGKRTSPNNAFAKYVAAREEAGTLSPSHLITVDSYSFPPLHWAAILSRACAVSFLLSRSFKATDRVPETGQTPLHTMVLYGPMTRWQTKDGVNAFRRVLPLLDDTLGELDNNSCTPLHAAASKLDCEMEKHSPKLQAQYLGIFTCLVKCVSKSSKKRELLGQQDNNGDTVMHVLAGKRNATWQVIRRLRRIGASLTVKNKEGKTPFDIAMDTNSGTAQFLNPDTAQEVTSDTDPDSETQSDDTEERSRQKVWKRGVGLEDSRLRKHTCRKSASAALAKHSNSISDDSSGTEDIDVDAVVACASQGAGAAAQVMNNQVATSQVTNSQVGSSQVANSQVANDGLANSQVSDSSQVAESQVTNGQVANGQDTNSQEADDQVVDDQVANKEQTSESQISTSTSENADDVSPLQKLLVEGGVWDSLPSIALKRKRRLEKELTNCEEELKVSILAVQEATSGLQQAERQLYWHSAEIKRMQKELLTLASERDKWKVEIKKRKTELETCKSATETKASAIKLQMLRLDTLAKHVESMSPKPKK
jgi:hypothetical protein